MIKAVKRRPKEQRFLKHEKRSPKKSVEKKVSLCTHEGLDLCHKGRIKASSFPVGYFAPKPVKETGKNRSGAAKKRPTGSGSLFRTRFIVRLKFFSASNAAFFASRGLLDPMSSFLFSPFGLFSLRRPSKKAG